jgi:hypothetical protein
MLNKQEIFDTVAKHLLKQMEQSLTHRLNGKIILSTQCAYRGDSGCKCAIGCLIPDDRYDPSLEGNDVVRGLVRQLLIDIGIDMTNFSIASLIIDLQHTHDAYEPKDWAGELVRVGVKHKLILNNAIS